ncbi:MAG: T9SS type A sorting domain-containing protein [Bacteroidetes bacterium]|nr:T9SS type A sorting domain-containing protein [Bacteroidota bacterium]
MKYSIFTLLLLISFSKLYTQEWQSIDLSHTSKRTSLYLGQSTSHNGKLFINSSEGLMVSNDDGKTFDSVNYIGSDFRTKMFSSQSRLYTVANGSVVYSKDDGKSFEYDTVGLLRDHNTNLLILPEQFFAHDNGRVLFINYSINYGQYYKLVTDSFWRPIDSPTINQYSSFTSTGDTLFQLDSHRVSMSIDNGKNWTYLSNNNLPNKFYPEKIYATGNRVYIILNKEKPRRNSHVIYYTDNLGLKWDSLLYKRVAKKDRDSALQIPFSIFSHKSQVWINLTFRNFLEELTIVSSADKGKSFVMDKGLPQSYFPAALILNFFIHKNYVFATSAENYIFYQKLTGSSNIESKFNIDFSFYPNPANQYFEVENNEVGLFIHDLIGNLIYEIKPDQSIVDVSALKPGSYFIRTENGAFKKLIIAR